MITFLLLQSITSILNFLTSPLALLPVAQIPDNVLLSFNNIISNINNLNNLFPINTMMTVFSIFLAIESSLFIYTVIKWMYRKIPGIS